jgi:tetratricopeptide (TPR) repeat protein
MDRLAIGSLVLLWASQVVSAAERPTDPPPSPQQIHRLIEALGDADYFARQKAESDLGKIGFDALEAVTAATEHDDMEIALRANRLLSAIRSNWSLPGESADVGQLLAEYESQDDDGREARVVRLVDLPEDQGIPAVCRIICYERSLLVAKRAALRLLEARGGEAPKPELAATLQKGLGTCRRAPARWVLAWLQARQEPQAIAKLWTQLAAEEEGLLLRQPRDTSLPIVEDLLQFQIVALRKIDRGADAAGSVERWIKLRRGEPDELARLLNWLIDQKDWPATRIVEKRCQAMIAESADLLYLIAEAQVLRGDAAAAEQSAGRALKLNPDGDESSLEAHFRAGSSLEQRGRLDWATSEWEHVVHVAPPHSPIGVTTARSLAELYHDRERDDRAAETLGGIERAYAKRSNQWSLLDRDPENGDELDLGTLRARRDYFEACHWKTHGDRAKQRECLDKALATQSYDIEVLIECYQIPGPPADYRSKVRQLIEKRLCELREQAADLGANPAAAGPCNEFAWLAANTEGDLDEALRLSKRSLDLVGERGAFSDTLARVYFANGDYAEAVKHQTRAAELLPYTRAVQKQLVLFRKTAGEKGINLEEIDKIEKRVPTIKRAAPPIEQRAPLDDDPFGSFRPLQ